MSIERLKKAIEDGDVVGVRSAMGNGADPNKRQPEDNYTLLSRAIIARKKAVVQEIVTHPLFEFNSETAESVLLALITGQPELLPWILDSHDIDEVSLDEWTCAEGYMIDIAYKRGYGSECLWLLMSHGAKAFYPDFQIIRILCENIVSGLDPLNEKADRISGHVRNSVHCFFQTLPNLQMMGIISNHDIAAVMLYFEVIFKKFPVDENSNMRGTDLYLKMLVILQIASKMSMVSGDVLFDNKAFHRTSGLRRLNLSLENFNKNEKQILKDNIFDENVNELLYDSERIKTYLNLIENKPIESDVAVLQRAPKKYFLS